MKILTATFYHYYGKPKGIEPQFYYLYKVPQAMGHQVDFFDYQTMSEIDIHQMRRSFLYILKGGSYDAVFIATFRDEFDVETLEVAKKYTNTFAWNSDDEWRWGDYSSKYADHYTYMVTNSPDVYEREKSRQPNLLHAQWACTGLWDGRQTKKDIDFSFVGQVYGSRAEQINYLEERAGLEAYGKGTGHLPSDTKRRGMKESVKELLRPLALRIVNIPPIDETINFEEVNDLWNRSKISFTPLDSSQKNIRQIKSRVFDMGLSGTLMLAHNAPHLNDYYEPGKEYIPFETMEECTEKARYYLEHESERAKIAEAYANRTLKEHLWKFRIQKVLREVFQAFRNE